MVNDNIQQIQNYLNQEYSAEGKIRFPRGFIRTASHFRRQLPFISDQHIKDNLAYAFIQSDVYRWLTNRTDLFGSAKEMIMKSGIALMGSICETLIVSYTRGEIGRKHGFCIRCDRMVEMEMISSRLRDELHWLWEARAAIHIYELDHREYEKYRMLDYNRAIRATKALRDEIEAHFLVYRLR